MSDSDSGPEFVDYDDIRHGAKLIYVKDSPFVALQPPDDIYERWNKIPVSLKKKAAQLMHVSAFWYHILLCRENHNTTRWAVQVGFLDANVSNDLSLKRLHRIEILEAILRAMEKGCLLEDQTRHMIWISNTFNLHVLDGLDDAICWLEQTGEPRIKQQVQELGPRGNCFAALQLIFAEYAHYTQAMGVSREKFMRELAQGPCQWFIEKSEEMKAKGNDQFQKKKYDAAVKYYSKAIKYHPENHIIYGNRALCYIRSEKYLKAVGDGKRATLIQPEWAKGHYRYCEAMFLLGDHKRAMAANKWAQTLCKADPEGMKDLLQQHAKFNIEMEESKCCREEESKVGRPNKTATKKVSSKRTESTTRADTTESRKQTAKSTSKVEPSTKSTAPENKCSGVKVESLTQPLKAEEGAHSLDNAEGPKETKSQMADKKSSKSEHIASEKPKGKSRNQHSKTILGSSRDPSVRDALVSAVQNAHTALADQRYRNAAQAFSQALVILETSTPKELGLCALDQVVLIYGHASALLEIGQPEELAEAKRDFGKIITFEERKFQCLVFYGIGKVYQKENRFPFALQQFSDSMQMVKKKITPGKLTWPTTKVIVEETKLDYFKELLEESIERCKFPPKPDAICQHQNCHGHSKMEIYFTDPDFKGFIRVVCCQNCKVEYHISCWKKLKATAFSDKNEKDFLQEICFTPECGGRICHIKIYDSTGLVKCEFVSLASIEKPTGTAKLRVNQKCSSLKKLKSKEHRKLRRKQHRQDASLTMQDKNDQMPLENRETIIVEQKALSPWLSYRDCVLLQISESKDLFRDKSHSISLLMKNLKPWMDMDRIKRSELGMLYAGRQPETLGDVVELLLERKNRVWARIFIHSLSGCLDTSPKLHDWAHKLDSSGLNAAGLFIDRYADHLEQLDLAPLLHFAPLQDMLIEKFGTMPEFFSRLGLTVMEYLKQAPPQEMRLFIWTLEEHRDQYTSCHAALDYYFEIMDGLCVVIKKNENENTINSPFKTKNRNHKKKQKEPKGSVVLSGVRGGTSREDEDEDFFEEDSLVFLDPSDPFSVHNHLRDQVTEFEGQYNNGSRSSHYKRILDNSPDPTKESLYDYFAQILEEYGPLKAQDPQLVGELDNFPPDAQQKIQEAGGLKPFLLESLRFVMTDNLLGLMKHAVLLQDANTHRMDDLYFIGDIPNRLSLNPSAMAFLPNPQDFGTRDYDEELIAIIPVRPNTVQFRGDLQAIGTPLDKSYDKHYLDNLEDLDLYISDVDEKGVEAPGKTAAEVQVSTCVTLSEVAVNTETCDPFERNNGDMAKKEKSNAEFEQQIQQIKQDYDTVKQRRLKEISALEGELEKINHLIQISHKELDLFQQKLEEEVKKDQQKKKENQETVKALKTEIKELAESQESISKSICEKNKDYETHLNNVLKLSNQSAVEKMNLEDEIKRCRDLCAKATRRSEGAELSILENRRGTDLRCLYRSLSEARAILAKLKEVASRFPTQILQSATDAWGACVQEAEEKVCSTELQYQDHKEQVKRGTRLCTLPPVAVPSPPRPPPVPMLFPPQAHQQLPRHLLHMRGHTGMPSASPVSAMAQSVALSPGSANGPSGHFTRPPQQNQAPQPNNVYERIMDRLSIMFPHYSRLVLYKFTGEMRTANGGCLTSLSYEEVINRVAQHILDHKDNSREQLSSAGKGDPGAQPYGTPSRSDSPASVRSTGTPPPANVWKRVGAHKHSQSKALNMEDPCIICHEDMSQEDLCVLECRHSFHRECIKSWLKEQSTCPTCREHALLPEDFPLLLGRICRGHTSAFS